MADKTIGQLVAAPSNLSEYTGQELFVLEQNNTAKKLTMQILENWLVSFADGHGGIQTINKTGTSGLVDTYTITFADQSTATFTVTNGNGITGLTQYWAVSSSNTTVPSSWSTTRQTMTPTNKYLWSYMTFARDSGSFSTTKSVVGVYGDTGQAWYVWIKYAGVQPTSDADMGDTPDNWMGLYSGTQATAPTSYTAYQWFEIKGETGNTGATGASIASVTRTGGTGEPGSTDTYTITLDTGTIAGTFTVYNGLNGSGAVSSVNGVNPDASGNVTLAAANISTSGGTTVQAALTDISENKQNRITANGILKGNSTTVSAATLGTDYTAVDDTLATSTTKTYSVDKINSKPNPNLLENWYFVGGGSQQGYGYFPLNSKGQTVYNGYNNPFIDRWGCGGGATVASGYITLRHGDWVTQDFDGSLTAYDGKTLTASILLADGTLLSGSAVPASGAASYVDDNNIKLYSGEASGKFEFVIRIVNTDINVVAVKLEIGSTQTLAHQENGVWVLNEVPSYGEEYAETVVSRAVATNGLIKAVTYSIPASLFGSFAKGELKQVSYTFPTAVPGTVINACMYGAGGWQIVIQIDALSTTGVVFHCANVGAAFTFDSGRELTVFYY